MCSISKPFSSFPNCYRPGQVAKPGWFGLEVDLWFRYCWWAEHQQISSLCSLLLLLCNHWSQQSKADVQYGISPARSHGGMPPGRWGITVFWEGEKGKEDTRRQLWEEELKTRPGKFHGTVNFFSDTSPALENGLNYEILTNWSSWLATLKLSNWRTSLN